MTWTREKELAYLKKRQENVDNSWNSYKETAMEQSRRRLRGDAFQSQEWQDKDLALGKRAEYEHNMLRMIISGAVDYNRRVMRSLFAKRLSSMLDAGFQSVASREEYCKRLLEKRETPILILCSALKLTEDRVSEIAAEIGVDFTGLPVQMKLTLGDEYRIRRRPWLEPDCASSEDLRQDKSQKYMAEGESLETLNREYALHYSQMHKSWEAEAVVEDIGAGDSAATLSLQSSSPGQFRGEVARQVFKAIKWRVLYERLAAFNFGLYDQSFISEEIARELAGLRILSVPLIVELTERSIVYERLEACRRMLKELNVPKKLRQTLRRPEDGTEVSGIEKGKSVKEWTLTLPDTFAELEQLAGSGRQ